MLEKQIEIHIVQILKAFYSIIASHNSIVDVEQHVVSVFVHYGLGCPLSTIIVDQHSTQTFPLWGRGKFFGHFSLTIASQKSRWSQNYVLIVESKFCGHPTVCTVCTFNLQYWTFLLSKFFCIYYFIVLFRAKKELEISMGFSVMQAIFNKTNRDRNIEKERTRKVPFQIQRYVIPVVCLPACVWMANDKRWWWYQWYLLVEKSICILHISNTNHERFNAPQKKKVKTRIYEYWKLEASCYYLLPITHRKYKLIVVRYIYTGDQRLFFKVSKFYAYNSSHWTMRPAHL